MTFNNETTVEPCNDVVDEVPTVKFSFVPIVEITKIEKDTMIGKNMVVEIVKLLECIFGVHVILVCVV